MIRRRFAFRTAGSAGRRVLCSNASHRRPGTCRVCLGGAAGARRERLDRRRTRAVRSRAAAIVAFAGSTRIGSPTTTRTRARRGRRVPGRSARSAPTILTGTIGAPGGEREPGAPRCHGRPPPRAPSPGGRSRPRRPSRERARGRCHRVEIAAAAAHGDPAERVEHAADEAVRPELLLRDEAERPVERGAEEERDRARESWFETTTMGPCGSGAPSRGRPRRPGRPARRRPGRRRTRSRRGGGREALERASTCSTQASPAGQPHEVARPPAHGGAVEGAVEDRVGALDAERPRPLEAAARACRGSRRGCRAASGPRRRGGRRAACPSSPSEVERSGSTGRGRGRPSTLSCAATPIETAPPIEKPISSARAPRRVGEIEGRLGVGHARVERVPALHPVAHLGEGDLRVPRRELLREQLARRAPGSRDLLRRAAVREDGGEAARPRSAARLAARRQRDEAVLTPHPGRGTFGGRRAVSRRGARTRRECRARGRRRGAPRPRRRARPSRRAGRSRAHPPRREHVVEPHRARRRRGRSSPRRGTGRARRARPPRRRARGTGARSRRRRSCRG